MHIIVMIGIVAVSKSKFRKANFAKDLKTFKFFLFSSFKFNLRFSKYLVSKYSLINKKDVRLKKKLIKNVFIPLNYLKKLFTSVNLNKKIKETI